MAIGWLCNGRGRGFFGETFACFRCSSPILGAPKLKTDGGASNPKWGQHQDAVWDKYVGHCYRLPGRRTASYFFIIFHLFPLVL